MRGLAYQLVIDSPHLPGWFLAAPPDRPADVTVALREPGSGPTDPAAPGQRLSYPGIAEVTVHDGTTVTIALDPTVDTGVIDLLLAGPVLGVVLHQRGALVQHASAVRANDGALVFTGGSTWGKSTTAASLCRQGFPLVADDVVPLMLSGDDVTTVPGYPACKLWPDAAAALGLEPDDMPPIGLEGEKRRLDAPERFLGDPLPVTRVYVLEQGEATRIEPLSGRAAFVELVRHSYLARYLGAPEQQRRRFSQVERIVGRVQVRTLMQGPIDELGAVAAVIEADLAGDGSKR